ncbi:2-(trimethylamino)ethylphosphonate dioxygenase-like isoform X2 [Crassostrea virginica]|uniref:Uncharacterized protein LOC111130742 n=1 Tax=Crassostrea virginica TaxID=6565 RepID=A0A8B8E1J2_CRAVI|nr:uncharacterized protein LOC111130742 [Crassostrea virginica]XP_022333669.1 uncharacterized protein LOC111130742 [Crassostrea virginica]XP_022333670.1 uncharacterized protein LOC111130742 [Crassostrea virginica]XP_022333671.1 uncharacterized protein LOC111130742 [Crassostrea virginica]XP_022333673.1 uncharacterized protein LOC111130742 [Crassostrea virginica]
MSTRHCFRRLSSQGALTLGRHSRHTPKQWKTPVLNGMKLKTNGNVLCSRYCFTKPDQCIKNQEIKAFTIKNGSEVKIVWKDGSETDFHSIWLRNNCHCSECKQELSGQKLINVGRTKFNTRVKTVAISDQAEKLIVHWSDEHEGVLPLDFLSENAYSDVTNEFQPSSVFSLPKTFPTLEFSEVSSGSQGVLKWLKDLNEFGFCMLKNVPQKDGMVCKTAEFIAPVQQTIYGVQFDVVSTPSPINVAYSSVGLDFHMDLIYYESAPGLQLLHCMKFDDRVQGGESTLLDLFYVAEEFRRSNPDEFYVLTQIPTTFQKIHYQRENPVHMVYQKPILTLNHRQEITSINWAPAFEGPLCVRSEDVVPYYKAYHKFAEAIDNSSAKLEFKMVPGDLISFNNRRVLHGRNAFTLNGGMRHLQGCYVNIDEYKSKLCYLSNKLKDKHPIRQVGNQCWT